MARQVKSRRRSSRRKVRRTAHTKRSRQQGGGSCAAMPQMNQAFPQRGGMAPIAQGDSYLLDAATRVQAEVGPLDKSFMELPSVIPKQMGGRRRASRKSHKAVRSRSRSRRSGRSRKSHRREHTQKGGMMDFDSAYRYAPQGGYAGENNQIHTEQTVNSMFKIAGPQA